MRVGIIDSGIDRTYVDVNDINIVDAAAFYYQEMQMEIYFYNKNDLTSWLRGENEYISDQHGHGTAVLGIINGFDSGNIDFVIAKVLDEQKKGFAVCFVEALKWMIERDVDIINVSLGADGDYYKDELYGLTKIAQKKGIRIFCAASKSVSYPACLNTVLTVSDVFLFNQLKGSVLLDDIVMLNSINYVEQGDFVVFKNGSNYDKRPMCTSFACAQKVREIIKQINGLTLV